jgi:transposase
MSSPSRARRAFSAKFKAEVVLSLLTGTKTQAELCRLHELSPNLLGQWKDAFLQNAAAAFETREQTSADAARVAELERALGRATLENDILKKASSFLNQNGGKRS